MRRLDPLTPDEARELDALDRALSGLPVDPDLGEFEELVADLRATAPEMSPAFAARLERDVADGFPVPAERPRLRHPRRWALLPAAGVLAAALVALVVVLGQGEQSTRGTAESTVAQSSAPARPPAAESAPAAPGSAAAADSAGAVTAQRKAAPALAAPPPAASAVTTAPAPVAPASGPRKVERSATLALETPADTFDDTTDDVVATVDRFGGIVASSTIGSDDKAGGEASFDLRIPTGRLDEALAALSKLGHVASRNQNLQDITASFESTQDSLADARAERRGLLRALARATTQGQIDSLRARLRANSSTISRLKGDLAALRRRAALSRVSLTVRGVEDGAGAATGGKWSTRDAAGDALRVLEVMAGVALVTLAIVVPLGLLGVAIAFGARANRRRGRERALDPA